MLDNFKGKLSVALLFHALKVQITALLCSCATGRSLQCTAAMHAKPYVCTLQQAKERLTAVMLLSLQHASHAFPTYVVLLFS